jgi:integrase/recombinase XerD
MNIATLSRHTLADCLDRYTEWLATTRRYAERSKREYRDDVGGAIQYLQERCRIHSAPMVQRRHLAGYLAHCGAAGQAASSRRRSVAAIRSFFAFLVAEGTIRHSPAAMLLPPERETRPPRVLTEDEYTRLRAAASDNPRDLAIIELALQTGLRVLEIARLRRVDVVLPHKTQDPAAAVGSVRVIGRGSHSRVVTLNVRACAALSDYLSEREESDSPALFLTKFGRGIGPRGIENVVAKYCKEAGIIGASVHTLRHTMAVQMLKRGATLAVVAKALGHESMETMGIYIDLTRGYSERHIPHLPPRNKRAHTPPSQRPTTMQSPGSPRPRDRCPFHDCRNAARRGCRSGVMRR